MMRFLRRAAAVLLSASVGIVAIEACLQATAPYVGLCEPYFVFRTDEWHAKRRLVGDEVLRYRPAPGNVFEISAFDFSTRFISNSRGFRGPDLEACGGKRRIFMVGDSMIHAAHVSDGLTSSEILERLLEAAGLDYCVHNLAVGSYSGIQYFNLVRLYGGEFRPEIVIVAVSPNDPFHDFDIHAQPERRRREDGLVIEMGALADAGPINRTWHDGLYVPWILRRTGLVVANVWAGRQDKSLYDRTFAEDVDAPASVTMRHMKAIRDMAETWGGRTVVTVLPWANQVGPDQMEPGYNSISTIRIRDEPRRDYQRRMAAAAAAAGVDLADVLPPMRARAATGVRFFLRHDGHFDAEGNREYAALLFGILLREGLLVR